MLDALVFLLNPAADAALEQRADQPPIIQTLRNDMALDR